MVAVLVLGHFEAFDLTVARARGHDRDFPLELDVAFQDAGRGLHVPPAAIGSVPRGNLGLALAIIAELARLQHRWQADLFHGFVKLHRAVHRGIGGGGDFQRADEVFFDQAVLCDFQRPAGRAGPACALTGRLRSWPERARTRR